MAVKAAPGAKIQTFKHNNTITYSATAVGGSVHANGNFAVGPSANDEVGLVADNGVITGELLEVSSDGYCSVKVEGIGLQFKQGTANGASAGNALIGATGDSVGGQTGGYVKNATAAQARFSRGLVTDISATTKNAIITTNFP